MSQHTRFVNRTPSEDLPSYSPILASRPCARCGQRDQWRRLLSQRGGWACKCSVLGQLEPEDAAGGGHTCTPSCLLAAVS